MNHNNNNNSQITSWSRKKTHESWVFLLLFYDDVNLWQHVLSSQCIIIKVFFFSTFKLIFTFLVKMDLWEVGSIQLVDPVGILKHWFRKSKIIFPFLFSVFVFGNGQKSMQILGFPFLLPDLWGSCYGFNFFFPQIGCPCFFFYPYWALFLYFEV